MFDFSEDISTLLDTDIGQLKGWILARGDKVANYRDITGLTKEQYEDSLHAAGFNFKYLLVQILNGVSQLIDTVYSFINFNNRDYVTFDRKASISNQQAGLGVQIADVVHTRNHFLDQYYRTEPASAILRSAD